MLSFPVFSWQGDHDAKSEILRVKCIFGSSRKILLRWGTFVNFDSFTELVKIKKKKTWNGLLLIIWDKGDKNHRNQRYTPTKAIQGSTPPGQNPPFRNNASCRSCDCAEGSEQLLSKFK